MLHDYVHCDENKSYDDETIMMKANLAREKLFEIDIVRREMRNLVQEHCNLLVVDDCEWSRFLYLILVVGLVEDDDDHSCDDVGG